MPTPLTLGLTQLQSPNLPLNTSADDWRTAMLAAHTPLIEAAANQNVQMLGFQELMTGPYFAPSQDTRWYDLAECANTGPTVSAMRKVAKQTGMVLVVPLYEEAMSGLYYNTAVVIDADGEILGKYRKTHLPQVAGFWEKFFFRPGNLGYPVFNTRYGKLGVMICYDRHFPEVARALGLAGAEVVFNPSATVAGLSETLWGKEQVAHAIANGYFMAANNRVGSEAPWEIGHFYGSSYIASPYGEMVAQASRDNTELLVATVDLDEVRQARNLWQFYRDRRPDSYALLVEP
jgi:beta-ureidopropionase